MNLKKTVAALFLIPVALGMSQTARADFSFRISLFDPYCYVFAHLPAYSYFYSHPYYPYRSYYTPVHYYYPPVPYYYSHSYYPYYSFYPNYWYYRYYPYYSYYWPYRYRYPYDYKRHHDHDNHHDNHHGDHHDQHRYSYDQRSRDHADRDRNGYHPDRHDLQQGPAPRYTPDSRAYFYHNPKSVKSDNGSPLPLKSARRDRAGNAAHSNTAVYDTKVDQNKADRNNEIAERLARKNSAFVSTERVRENSFINHNNRQIRGDNNPAQESRVDTTARPAPRETSTRRQFQGERPQTRHKSDGLEQRRQRPDNSSSLRQPGTRRSDRTEMRDEKPRMLQTRPVESRSNNMTSRQRSPERGNEISMNAPRREERAGFSGNRGFGREHAFIRRDR